MSYTCKSALQHGIHVFWQFENGNFCAYLLGFVHGIGYEDHYKYNRWLMLRDGQDGIWAKEDRNYEMPFVPQPEFQPSHWVRTGLFSTEYHEGKAEYDEDRMKVAKAETDNWMRACQTQANMLDDMYGRMEERREKEAEKQGYKYGFGNHFKFTDDEVRHYIGTGQWIPLDDLKREMLLDKIPFTDMDGKSLRENGYRKLTGRREYTSLDLGEGHFANALEATKQHGSGNDIWWEDIGLRFEERLLGLGYWTPEKVKTVKVTALSFAGIVGSIVLLFGGVWLFLYCLGLNMFKV
jgi:hypothetical protein